MSAASSSAGRLVTSGFSKLAVANIILFALCLSAVAYYVAGANARASGEYYLTQLRYEVASLTEEQGKLIAEKSSAENPAAAAEFAKAAQMVVAQDMIYVFENGNIALRR